MHRRFFVQTGSLVALGLVGRPGWLEAAADPDPVLTIYKSANCSCCAKWVEHITAAGLNTIVYDRDTLDEIKDRLGVPTGVRSCHTAEVEGYVIEGHVPAGDVRQLLAQGPKVAGLAVPGMPLGAPGMEVHGGGAGEPYEVVAFQRDGTTEVFARH